MMAVTLGELNLGVVNGLSFCDQKRLQDADLPAARGSSSQDLGELSSSIELTGILRGPSRFDDFRQFQRYKRIGNSLKLDSETISTVVFVKEVKLAKIGVNFLRYGLSLKESLFKQVNACDSILDWSSSTIGAIVSCVALSPVPLEGSGCIKVSHNAEAAEEVNLAYDPLDTIDLEDFDWLSFGLLISDASQISSAILSVSEGVNNATFDFSALLMEADKWQRLCVYKTFFSNYGALDWGQIDKLKVAVTKSQAQNYYFAVDDLGGFE
jgi:hypothetical protein